VSKGPWSGMKSTEVVRLIEAVTKATGLPVRNVEYNSQTKVLRVSVDPAADVIVSVPDEDLRKLL
jgi:hypothetical protein